MPLSRPLARMGRGTRLASVATALVLVLAACTSGDETEPSTAGPTSTSTTTGAAAGGTDPAQMINDALGGTQAVQDFTIHLDLARVENDEQISFYDALLAKAMEGAGEPVDLQGDFTFTPVTSLEAEMIDADGNPLPSLSVDFGLLRPSVESLESARSDLVHATADPALKEYFAELPVDGPGFLVEIVTADFRQKRLHVGPGDRSVIDVTSLAEFTVGDNVVSLNLFGETLPGDSASEAGLAGLELFQHRWNEGHIAFLGDETGTSIVLDETLTIVEGSFKLTREGKRALLKIEYTATAARMRLELEAHLSQFPESDNLYYKGSVIERDDQRVWVADGKPVPAGARINGYLGYEFVVGFLGGYDFAGCTSNSDEQTCLPLARPVTTTVPRGRALALLADRFGQSACTLIASKLNKLNAAGGAVLDTSNGITIRAPKGESEAAEEESETPEPRVAPVSCDPPPEPSEPAPDPPPPGPPVGTVLGDVHVRTFDGKPYENQATGEFLFFDDGSTMVQGRLVPWPRHDSASIASAFAVRVDGHELSMHVDGRTWIDGELADLPRGQAISLGDASLLRWGQGWVVVAPDGTVIRVQDVATALLLTLTPASPGATGLLGNLDGDPGNDFVTRDGRQLPDDADGDFDAFYAPGGFIDSWRISSDESLFHYEPDETTEGFVIEGFPAGPSVLETFPLEDVSRADEICRSTGVTREDAFEDCVFDVAVTGEPGFAYAAFLGQEATRDTVAPRDVDGEVVVTRPSVEGGSIVVFGGTVIEFGADPPIQDPGAPIPRWQCTADDTSFFATSRFQETPPRLLEVAIEYLDASRSNTGQGRLSVIVKLNDEDYAWALSYDERFAGLSIEFDGTTLRASGSGFLNEPLDTRLHPIVVLPEDAELSPFSLEAVCG